MYDTIRNEVHQNRGLIDRKKKLEKELFELRVEIEEMHDDVTRLQREHRLGQRQLAWYRDHQVIIRLEHTECEKSLKSCQEMFETEKKKLETQLVLKIKETADKSNCLFDLETLKCEFEQTKVTLKHLQDEFKVKDPETSEKIDALQDALQSIKEWELQCGTVQREAETWRNQMKAQEAVKLRTLSMLQQREKEIQSLETEVHELKEQRRREWKPLVDPDVESRWKKLLELSDQRVLWTEEKLIQNIRTAKTLEKNLLVFQKKYDELLHRSETMRKVKHSLEKRLSDSLQHANMAIVQRDKLRTEYQRHKNVLENLRNKQKTVLEERDSYKKESDDQKKQIVALQKKIEKLQTDKKKTHRYGSFDRESEVDKLKKQNLRLQERLKHQTSINSQAHTEQRLQDIVSMQYKIIARLKQERDDMLRTLGERKGAKQLPKVSVSKRSNNSRKRQLPEEPAKMPPKKKQATEQAKLNKPKAQKDSEPTKRKSSETHKRKSLEPLKRKSSPLLSGRRPKTKQKEKHPVPKRRLTDPPKQPKAKPKAPKKPRTKIKPSPTTGTSDNASRPNKRHSFPDESRPRKIMKPNSDEESSEEFEPDPHKWFGAHIFDTEEKLMYGSLVLHDNPGKCTSVGDTIQIRWKQQPHLEFGDIDSIWEVKSNKGKKFSLSRAYIKASSANAKGKFGRNELFQINMEPAFEDIWCRYIIRSTLVWFPPQGPELTEIESETSGREHFFCRFIYDRNTHELSPISERIRTEDPPWSKAIFKI